jgi:acyl-CoA hydrolase
MTALRHAGGRVVTASIERMDFISPIEMGENMLIKTSVNMAHRSSMEIGARIEAENAFTGETRHVATAYLIFVGLDEEGRPKTLPALMPENDNDRRRMLDAVKRRARRRKERQKENAPGWRGVFIP